MTRFRTPGLVAAVLLLALFVISTTAVGKNKKGKDQVDLRKWANGPVLYIALKDELKAFRTLENDRDRSLFIERFWARRDPTPETLTNEFRQLFWERVQQANANFIDTTKPGWKTDRGKIHILYGPPTEIQEDIHVETEGLPTGGRGLIRWIYEGRPDGRMDLDPIVVIPFVGDASGEYRVSTDPTLASVFFDWTRARETTFAERKMDKILNRGMRGLTSPLSVMLDLGRMQEVPPSAQVLLESVETSESYETFPLEVKTDRYYDARDRESVVVLTVDVSPTSSAETPAVIARFEPLDFEGPTRMLGEDSFRFTAGAGIRLAQGRISLEPGKYSVTVITADPADVSTGMSKSTVVVERSNERMRFSDLVWAAELESLPYAALSSHSEPFIVGPFRVVPRFEGVFAPGDTLRLFYEVYGATFPLHLTYQVQGQEDDGRWVPLGRPQVAEQSASAQGWELPTSPRWPLGEYRVVIEIQDSEERLITTRVPFRLEKDESS